jgi:predicted transcriptional regulator
MKALDSIDKVLAISSSSTNNSLQADEFTVDQFAERAGCTRRRAKDQLKKLFDDGLVDRRNIVLNGYATHAYKPH